MNISINYRALDEGKVNQSWDKLITQGFNLPKNAGADDDIKDEFVQTDTERLLAAIAHKDWELITQASRASFSDSFNLQNEEILAWLFYKVLGVRVEDEDFFLNNAITGIPLELWVSFFQKLTPPAMETLKVQCKKSNYSFDQFRTYLLGVKNVVKFCLDNHSPMIAYYEGGTSGIMQARAQHIYKRVMPESQKVVV